MPFFCQTVLLEAGVFRGVAPAVSLSAESGKNEKGLPPNPKKQSPPKKPASATATEPFDNTIYKNLQHHNYSTYTFLDKPGPLQVQDAPALFRTGVPPPLRAQFKDYPFCVCLHSCLQSSRQSQDPACRILASGELAALL